MKVYFVGGIFSVEREKLCFELQKKFDDIRGIRVTDSQLGILNLFSSAGYSKIKDNDPILANYKLQAEILKPQVEERIKNAVVANEGFIFHGIQLIPGFYQVPDDVEVHHIIITLNKEEYRQYMFKQWKVMGKRKLNDVLNVIEKQLEFQDYLIKCAKECNNTLLSENGNNLRPIIIIENTGNVDEMLNKILAATNNKGKKL